MHHQDDISMIVVSRPGIMQHSLLIVLAALPWLKIVGMSGDGLNALNLIVLHRPTLVMIDANLLDEEIATLLSAIKTGQSPPRCVVLRYSHNQTWQALAAHADAILQRDCTMRDLEETLLQVAQIS